MLAASAGSLSAQGAVIDNGRVRLGINDEGHLNFSRVGIFDIPSGMEATIPGCECESWGAGISGGTFNNVWGGAGETTGIDNVFVTSFTSTANSASSVVEIRSGGVGVLEVRHDYTPVPGDDRLYRVNVTLRNLTTETLGAGAQGLRYRRAMDWDIVNVGTEVVTINATVAGNVIGFSNNGFASNNPFDPRGNIAGCSGVPESTPFADEGPCDHGGVFDFAFPALAPGATTSFLTYYGTAPSEASMFAALAAVGIEAFTSAWCSPSALASCTGELGTTFAFGFEGVGAPPVLPDPSTGVVPEPGTWALLGTGLIGIAGVARRRRRA